LECRTFLSPIIYDLEEINDLSHHPPKHSDRLHVGKCCEWRLVKVAFVQLAHRDAMYNPEFDFDRLQSQTVVHRQNTKLNRDSLLDTPAIPKYNL